MASPILGGGIVVDRLEQLFISAIEADCRSSKDQAKFVLEIFTQLGERLVSEDGNVLETEEDCMQRLLALQAKFNESRLPLLRRAKVI